MGFTRAQSIGLYAFGISCLVILGYFFYRSYYPENPPQIEDLLHDDKSRSKKSGADDKDSEKIVSKKVSFDSAPSVSAPISKSGENLDNSVSRSGPDSTPIQVAVPIEEPRTSDSPTVFYVREPEPQVSRVVVENDDSSGRQQLAHQASMMEDLKAIREALIHTAERATKFYKVNQYAKALELYTEAIDGMHRESPDDADLPKLHNNRSAVYEKLEQWENSLSDTNEVLLKTVGHSKARIRKIRLLEKMGQERSALVEACTYLTLTRFSIITAEEKPIEEVAQMIDELTTKAAKREFETMKNNAGGLEILFGRCGSLSSYLVESFLHTFKSYRDFNESSKSLKKKMIDQAVDNAATVADKINAHLNRAKFCATSTRMNLAVGTSDISQAMTLAKENADAINVDTLYDAHLWFGLYEHVAYRLTSAHDTYQAAIVLKPNELEAHLKLSGVLLDMGDLPAAAAKLEEVESSSIILHDHVDFFSTRSQVRHMKKDMPGCIADLEKCIEKEDREIFWTKLGIACLDRMDRGDKLSHLEKARSCAERALALNSKSAEALILDSEILIMTDQNDEAMSRLDEAINANPSNPLPLVHKGVLVMASSNSKDAEKMNEAMSYFDRALTLDHNNIQAVMQKAQILIQMTRNQEDFNEAFRLIDRAVDCARTEEEIMEMIKLRLLTGCQLEGARSLPLIFIRSGEAADSGIMPVQSYHGRGLPSVSDMIQSSSKSAMHVVETKEEVKQEPTVESSTSQAAGVTIEPDVVVTEPAVTVVSSEPPAEQASSSMSASSTSTMESSSSSSSSSQADEVVVSEPPSLASSEINISAISSSFSTESDNSSSSGSSSSLTSSWQTMSEELNQG